MIYFVEAHPTFLPLAREVFRRVFHGNLVGYCSVIALTEAFTHPRRNRDRAQEEAYRTLVGELLMLNVNEVIAARAADLRARYSLRTPDALHLATAIEARCQAFLTNDNGLRRVAELRVLVLGALTR